MKSKFLSFKECIKALRTSNLGWILKSPQNLGFLMERIFWRENVNVEVQVPHPSLWLETHEQSTHNLLLIGHNIFQGYAQFLMMISEVW
jgi:hypothetical protein